MEQLNTEEWILLLRDLEGRATPGPWGNTAEHGSFLVVDDIGMRIICDPIRKIDAALIVALRNNILAILDDNERLRTENAQLQSERDAAYETIDAAIKGLTPVHDGGKAAERVREMLTGFRGPQEVEP